MPTNLVELILRAKDQAGKQLTDTNSKLNMIGKTATKVGGMLAAMGAASGGALIAMSVKASHTGDEIQKMHIRTGIATEELSKFAYIADLSDASLSDLSRAIKILSMNMLYANQGMETQKRVFEDLGVDWRDGEGQLKDLWTMFWDVSGALRNMTNETEQSALASLALGKGGTALLTILKLTREEVEAQAAEAEQLGIVWSIDDANAAAKFKDSVSTLQYALKGLTQTIGISLFPMLTEFAQKGIAIGKSLVAWTQAHNTLFPSLLRLAGFIAAGGTLLLGMGLIIRIAPLVAIAFNSWLGPIGLITTALGLLIGELWLIPEAQKAMMEATISAAKEMPALSKQVEELAKKYPELARQIRIVEIHSNWLKQYPETIDGLNVSYETLAEAWQKQKRALDQMILALMEEQVTRENARALTEEELRQLEAKRLAYYQAQVAADELYKSTKLLYEAQRDLRREKKEEPFALIPAAPLAPKPPVEMGWEDRLVGGLNNLQGMTYELNDAVQGAAHGMVNAFANAFANIFAKGQSFMQKMISLFTSLVSAIWAELAKLAAMKIVKWLVAGPFRFLAEAAGKVAGAQMGGRVTGGVPGRDSVPVMATPGEVILNVPIVKYLEALMSRTVGFGAQSGGMVPARASAAREEHYHFHDVVDAVSIRRMLRSGEFGEEIRAARARGDLD